MEKWHPVTLEFLSEITPPHVALTRSSRCWTRTIRVPCCSTCPAYLVCHSDCRAHHSSGHLCRCHCHRADSIFLGSSIGYSVAVDRCVARAKAIETGFVCAYCVNAWHTVSHWRVTIVLCVLFPIAINSVYHVRVVSNQFAKQVDTHYMDSFHCSYSAHTHAHTRHNTPTSGVFIEHILHPNLVGGREK